MTPELARQLDAIDWDFPRVDSGATQAAHWYPGTFPPQLPAAIIEAFSEVGDIVLDPFSGIGTTAAESIRLARRAWSVDANPVAALTTYVTSGLVVARMTSCNLANAAIADALELVTGNLTQGDLFQSHETSGAKALLPNSLSPPDGQFYNILVAKRSPQWDLLTQWYEPNTLKKIRRSLLRVTEANTLPFVKLTALLMISANLRAASSQLRSWGHIADKVLPRSYEDRDFGELCRRWAVRLAAGIARIRITPSTTKRRIHIRSWVSIYDWTAETSPFPNPRQKAKLLVTSPPYASAIDYTRSQRLSLHLLGYTEPQLSALGDVEIGARRKRFRGNAETLWANELSHCLREQVKFVDDCGAIALVMPHEDHGRELGSTEVQKSLADVGWHRVYSVNRSIRQLRARQSWTSIKRETIDIFEKSKERQ